VNGFLPSPFVVLLLHSYDNYRLQLSKWLATRALRHQRKHSVLCASAFPPASLPTQPHASPRKRFTKRPQTADGVQMTDRFHSPAPGERHRLPQVRRSFTPSLSYVLRSLRAACPHDPFPTGCVDGINCVRHDLRRLTPPLLGGRLADFGSPLASHASCPLAGGA
jgi:hypothetical protein